MVNMSVRALSNLHCEAIHEPSGVKIETDAPKDVGGEASSFSPTDLVGVALATCILTTMGLVANKMNLDLTGSTAFVDKIMRTEKPRRIQKLAVTLNIPVNPDAAAREKLEHAAHSCPVHHSLHPEIEKDIAINWGV